MRRRRGPARTLWSQRNRAALAAALVSVTCQSRLATRPEASHYTETSRYADVMTFLDRMRNGMDPSLHVEFGTLGRTSAGRAIPYVIASRAAVSPSDAHARGLPVVYVQANIHAGEVEGKEALLALLRDLTRGGGAASVLDSLVLIAVPIYNADGNDQVDMQSVNRTEQNGPAVVGRRPNGQGLDLNRDYVKAEAPETRASLEAFNRWDPDVFVDLHTTDGSFHGYALTYAPSLSPAASPYTRDSLLPELRRRMRERDAFETFAYGNFDTVPVRAWKTYDHRPRFGTNLVGIRGRIAILSEAYSHDPFERRIRVTYAFVREILSLVAERRVRAARLFPDHAVDSVPLRAELTRTPFMAPVVAESLARTGDSSITEPGVPRGFRRTGRFDTTTMPVYDRFVPTLERDVPPGYVVPAADTAAVRLLRLQGIRVDGPRAGCDAAHRFTIDSVFRDTSLFQGHHQERVVGRWTPSATATPVRVPCFLVSTHQPLGVLAVYLLEPESDDGLVTWNVFDHDSLHAGASFPVQRLTHPYAP